MHRQQLLDPPAWTASVSASTPPSIAMAALKARSTMTRETIHSPNAPPQPGGRHHQNGGRFRIVQARDQREIAASQGLPNLSGSVLANHSRQSENGILRLVQPAPGALAWLVAVPVTARTWAKNMRLRSWAAMLRRFSPDQAGRTSPLTVPADAEAVAVGFRLAFGRVQ